MRSASGRRDGIGVGVDRNIILVLFIASRYCEGEGEWGHGGILCIYHGGHAGIWMKTSQWSTILCSLEVFRDYACWIMCTDDLPHPKKIRRDFLSPRLERNEATSHFYAPLMHYLSLVYALC